MVSTRSPGPIPRIPVSANEGDLAPVNLFLSRLGAGIAAANAQSVVNVLALGSAGNSTGDSGSFSGSFAFQGTNNVTVSLSSGSNRGNTINISGPTLLSVGASNLGATAGSTGVVASRMVFVGISGISLSQSTAGESGTLSIIGPGYTAVLYASSNTTGAASSTTVDFRSLTLRGMGAVSVGASASEIIISAPNTVAQTAQTIGAYFSSNTTAQSSSSTYDARSLTFRGAGIASVGASAGEIIISVPAGGGAGDGVNIIAAGTQTANTTGTVVFSDSHNVTFGLSNSSVVTASASFPAQTVQTQNMVAIIASAANGNGTFSSGTLSLKNGSNITMSTGAGVVSLYGVDAQSVQTQNFVAIIGSGANGNGTFTSGTLSIKAGVAITISTGANVISIHGNPAVSGTQPMDVGTRTNPGTNTSVFAAIDHVHGGVAAIAAGSNTGNTAGDTGPKFGTWVIAGKSNITVSGSTDAGGIHTLWLSAPDPAGGAAATLKYFEPFYLDENTATSTGSLSQLHIDYFSLPANVSFGQVNRIGSASVANTGAGNTFSFRLTNNQSIAYSAVYTISNSNLVDMYLFSRGTGGFSTEIETFASTRNSFNTIHFVTFDATVNHTGGSTGSMTARQSQSMSISYPMITSGTQTSVNAGSTVTTWGTGYTTWASNAMTSITNTYNTTNTASTSCATTHPATTAWSSNKIIPLNWASSLTPGDYWLGMVRYSGTSSSSAEGATITAAGTGASYTVTYQASALTRTAELTFMGYTKTIASSLGFLGFASQATMMMQPGHGSFSGTYSGTATYLNNVGNPAGAIAFSQILSNGSFFKSWLQLANNRI